MDSSQGARVENGEFSSRHRVHVSLPPRKQPVALQTLGSLSNKTEGVNSFSM